MNVLLFVVECHAVTQLFQHVVHARHGEVGVGLLPRLAVRVQMLAQLTDALFLFVACVGERENFEAVRFDINRIVADAKTSACGERPRHVRPAR